MIRANLEYTTHNIILDECHYCAYCGKPIEPDVEIDHGDRTEYYHCNCENAMKEIGLMKEIKAYKDKIRMLQAEIPKPRYESKTIKKLVLKK